MLKSKCDRKSRFQQSAQGKAFTSQELKKNLQFIITLNSQDDQQRVMEDSKKQPAEIQERLQIAKESIKSKLAKFNSRKKHGQKKLNKNKSTILRLMPEDFVNRNVDHIFDSEKMESYTNYISGFIARVVKKHKDPMQTPFEIVYDSVYNDDGDSDND